MTASKNGARREAVAASGPAPSTVRGLLAALDVRCVVALVYAAVVLTLTEYFFLPGVVRRTGLPACLPGVPPDLASGLVWAASTYVFFLLGPTLLVRLGGGSLREHGWSCRGLGRHLVVYAALFVVMAPAVVVASARPDFAATYPFAPSARTSLERFVLWEAAYLLQFLALESFFRGYLLFTLARRFGPTAIAVAVVPYAMIHFHKPVAECLGAVVAGLVLGFLALLYRSFLGGVLLHAAVAFLMDFLAARRAGLL